jgi:hypothetical protein
VIWQHGCPIVHMMRRRTDESKGHSGAYTRQTKVPSTAMAAASARHASLVKDPVALPNQRRRASKPKTTRLAAPGSVSCSAPAPTATPSAPRRPMLGAKRSCCSTDRLGMVLLGTAPRRHCSPSIDVLRPIWSAMAHQCPGQRVCPSRSMPSDWCWNRCWPVAPTPSTWSGIPMAV